MACKDHAPAVDTGGLMMVVLEAWAGYSGGRDGLEQKV